MTELSRSLPPTVLGNQTLQQSRHKLHKLPMLFNILTSNQTDPEIAKSLSRVDHTKSIFTLPLLLMPTTTPTHISHTYYLSADADNDADSYKSHLPSCNSHYHCSSKQSVATLTFIYTIAFLVYWGFEEARRIQPRLGPDDLNEFQRRNDTLS